MDNPNERVMLHSLLTIFVLVEPGPMRMVSLQ
jgi:hypothetical protein